MKKSVKKSFSTPKDTNRTCVLGTPPFRGGWVGLFILLLAFSTPLLAQNDTLIINNDYKFKIGVKGLVERSGIPSLAPANERVYNYGAVLSYKLGKSRSFIETGVFSFTRRFSGDYSRITQRNIRIPLSYRLETKSIYFSVGFYGSYLIYKDTHATLPTYLEKNKDRKINLGYSLSLGIEKNVSSNISVFIEFESLNDLTSAYINTRASSFSFVDNDSYSTHGIAVGLYYKIQKQ